MTSDYMKETENQIPYGEILAGRYLVQEVIGSGGMGFVYRARDMHFPKADKIVAIKELLNSSLDINMREEIRKILEREANILVTLDHESIPKIFDYFSERNRAFLVLEFIEGSDLKTIMNEHEGFLPIHQVLSWALEICNVLSYLHNHQPDRFVFRDLKPSNIMINHENRVILIDFGIAKALQAPQKGTVIGTEGYSPPEQYRGEASPAVDIYAFGATLHFLLTRRDPQFEPPFTFHERPIREINPSVPVDLEEIINRSLAYHPEARYPSIETVQSALLECIDRHNLLEGGISNHISQEFDKQTTRLAWQYPCGDEIRGTPSVHNSIVYIGSYDNSLHAVDSTNGERLWKYETQGGIVGQPLISENTVYFGSEDHRLFAVSCRTGRLSWAYETEAPVRSSPRFAEGYIFIGTDKGTLHALNSTTGRSTWHTPLGTAIRSSPLLTDLGLFIGCESGDFTLIDFGGKIKWRFHARKSIISSPAAFKDLVLFTSLDGNFYALSQTNGWQQWSIRMGKGSASSPFVYENLAVFGSADGYVYAVELESVKILWKFDMQEQVSGSPICYNDKVMIGNSSGRIVCLSIENGKLIWEYQTQGAITGAPALGDNHIYLGSLDGNLYALSMTSD